MAIQFPPINIGDPEPKDGDTYLYLVTQQEFQCRRRIQYEAAQWSDLGTINPTNFGYRGTLEIQKLAPADAEKGNIYSVIDGGFADASFTGIAGDNIGQYSLLLFDNPNWIVINTGSISNSPWIRTNNGRILPAVETDDLDMDQGNYLINELPEL